MININNKINTNDKKSDVRNPIVESVSISEVLVSLKEINKNIQKQDDMVEITGVMAVAINSGIETVNESLYELNDHMMNMVHHISKIPNVIINKDLGINRQKFNKSKDVPVREGRQNWVGKAADKMFSNSISILLRPLSNIGKGISDMFWAIMDFKNSLITKVIELKDKFVTAAKDKFESARFGVSKFFTRLSEEERQTDILKKIEDNTKKGDSWIKKIFSFVLKVLVFPVTLLFSIIRKYLTGNKKSEISILEKINNSISDLTQTVIEGNESDNIRERQKQKLAESEKRRGSSVTSRLDFGKKKLMDMLKMPFVYLSSQILLLTRAWKIGAIPKIKLLGLAFKRILFPITFVSGVIAGIVKGFASKGTVLERFKVGLDTFLNFTVGWIIELPAKLLGWLVTKLGFENLGEKISGLNLTNITDTIGGWIGDFIIFVMNSFNSAKEYLSTLKDTIIIKKDNMIASIKSTFTDIFDWFGNLFTSIPDKVKSIVRRIPGAGIFFGRDKPEITEAEVKPEPVRGRGRKVKPEPVRDTVREVKPEPVREVKPEPVRGRGRVSAREITLAEKEKRVAEKSSQQPIVIDSSSKSSVISAPQVFNNQSYTTNHINRTLSMIGY